MFRGSPPQTLMKKVLWSLICLSLVLSIGVALHRIEVEQANNQVQLVMDFGGLEQLAKLSEMPLYYLLQDINEAGIQYVALPQRTLGEYVYAGREIPEQAGRTWDEYPAHRLELANMPVGFWPEDINLITHAGLDIVPRLGNPPWPIDRQLAGISTDLIIFAGNSVWGYPADLRLTRDWVREKGYNVGLVEFTNQAGIKNIADHGSFVRVHAITPGEMEILPTDRIISRYLRAARERNMRVMYLRPFLYTDNAYARTIEMVDRLTTELTAQGYVLGQALPYESWEVSPLLQWIIWSGAWAAALLLLSFWVPVTGWIQLILLVTGWGATVGLSFVNLSLAQQAVALLAAIVFPVLAIYLGPKVELPLGLRYLLVSGLSIIGGILIVGTLATTDYMIKLQEFRGVKLMHLAPVLLVFLYGLYHDLLPVNRIKPLVNRTLEILRWKIALGQLVVLGILLGVAGVYYILRTGNIGLPILEWEIALREFLEEVLVARPRTKEVFLGHPALFIALAIGTRKWSWWLVIAVIGQLSLVNTFTHIHTPLLITLLRTGYGLLFGGLIGWGVYTLCKLLWKGLGDDSPFRVLRF